MRREGRQSPSRRIFILYRHFVPLRPKEEAKLHVILNAVKNPTEELTVHILFTLVVGYFACAQYDTHFTPRDCRGRFAPSQ